MDDCGEELQKPSIAKVFVLFCFWLYQATPSSLLHIKMINFYNNNESNQELIHLHLNVYQTNSSYIN